MTAIEERPAKRAKTERKLLKNCPANEYLALCKDLFSGPTVTVIVEGKESQVPKALLCYNSLFFEAALNGEWKKSVEQKVELKEVTAYDFELVLQWMYSSNIVLPVQQVLAVKAQMDEGIKSSESGSELPEYEIIEDDDCDAWKITTLLNFLKIADRIQLLGPFDGVVHSMQTILVNSRDSLLPEHIKVAAALPDGHPIRALFANASVKPYIHDSNPDISIPDRLDFKLGRELDEIDAFAADLFREYDRTIRKRQVTKGNRGYVTYPDPLTNTRFSI